MAVILRSTKNKNIIKCILSQKNGRFLGKRVGNKKNNIKKIIKK